MKYRTRIYYTEADKALMWERWRQGESLQAIAQLFDRNHSTIGGILGKNGGHTPAAPYSGGLGAEAVGTRGDLSWNDGRTVDAHDGARTGTSGEHSEP